MRRLFMALLSISNNNNIEFGTEKYAKKKKKKGKSKTIVQ